MTASSTTHPKASVFSRGLVLLHLPTDMLLALVQIPKGPETVSVILEARATCLLGSAKVILTFSHHERLGHFPVASRQLGGKMLSVKSCKAVVGTVNNGA